MNPPSAGQAPQFLAIDLTLYAGRCIALVEGRIVAVADTADAALLRAKLARHQRQPTILRVDALGTAPSSASPTA